MDIHERFSYPNLFIDPDGLLELSLEQKVQFGGWKRPSQIMSDPQMIYYISSNSIIQVSYFIIIYIYLYKIIDKLIIFEKYIFILLLFIFLIYIIYIIIVFKYY